MHSNVCYVCKPGKEMRELLYGNNVKQVHVSQV